MTYTLAMKMYKTVTDSA